jgi:hypothetical protein
MSEKKQLSDLTEDELQNLSEAELAEYAKDVKYDNGRVHEMFESLIEQEADIKGVNKSQIAFCLFVMKKGLLGAWRTRCRLLSLQQPPAFAPEVMKIKEITEMDMLGHISKAIRLILQTEKEMYDSIHKTDSDFGKFECYIQYKNNELDLTMVYDKKPIRKFDLQKEFG